MSKSKNISCIHSRIDNDLFYLQLHITGKCNLRCKHCYEGIYKEDSANILNSKEVINIINQFNAFLHLHRVKGKIYFSGGEPILDPNLCLYIKSASNYHMCTMILSNGTLIDQEKALELRKSGLNIVQISLDGLENTHDYIRGKGMFQKATQGIENCNNARLKTTVMVTLSKLNMNEIEGIIQHCIKHNATRLAFGRLVPTGNGANLADQVLTKEETLSLFKKIKRLRKKYARYIYFSFHDPLWLNYFKVKVTYGCSAGIRGICITENGDFMPCRRLDLVIGNIRETSLVEIWNSEELRHYRDRDKYEGKCKKCKKLKKCGGCRAIARATCGSEFGEDPQCFF